MRKNLKIIMDIKSILKQNNFTFEKRFGQNFLTDTNLLKSIVEKSGVNANSTVVEIGVGAGTLTGEIAKQVKKVYGFEIDTKLKPVLNETIKDYNNVEIIFSDILKIGAKKVDEMIGASYSIIANLPYYITTPIIMEFVEKSEFCERVVVTVQKEVAERLVASPKTSDYGAITASIGAIANSKIIKYIDRQMFMPPPNVDSAVVRIEFDKNKFEILDIKEYRKLVKNAFSMRRKTLVNNLMKGYNLTRQEIENALSNCNVPVSVRGEELGAETYVELSNYLVKNGVKSK